MSFYTFISIVKFEDSDFLKTKVLCRRNWLRRVIEASLSCKVENGAWTEC